MFSPLSLTSHLSLQIFLFYFLPPSFSSSSSITTTSSPQLPFLFLSTLPPLPPISPPPPIFLSSLVFTVYISLLPNSLPPSANTPQTWDGDGGEGAKEAKMWTRQTTLNPGEDRAVEGLGKISFDLRRKRKKKNMKVMMAKIRRRKAVAETVFALRHGRAFGKNRRHRRNRR